MQTNAAKQRQADPASDRVRIVAGQRFAAVIEPGRIQLRALPTLDPVGEIGIDGDAWSNDVAFVDDDARLVVVSRDGGNARAHVVDPEGLAKLGELQLAPGARVVAVAGRAVLVAAMSATIVDPIALTTRALPIRGTIAAAGTLGQNQLVIASRGALEEWDVETCAPVRRVRVERPLDPELVGGDARRIWMVSGDTLDVIVPASRSTRRTRLPEPALRAISLGDTLAVIGATTRALYLVDLAVERTATRIDCGALADVAWLDARSLVAVVATGEAQTIAVPNAVPAPRALELVAEDASPEHGGWRADFAEWGRGARKRPALAGSPLAELAERCDGARAAIELLYAARLLGRDGVAPVELAAALEWRWDDVLGGGLDGLVRTRGDRCRLAAEATAILDEQPPLRGELVGAGCAPTGTVAVIAPAELDVATVAAWAAPIVGSVFAPNARGLAGPMRFLAEARWRGLAPLVPWTRWRNQLDVTPHGAVLVVASLDEARALDVPVVAEMTEVTRRA